MLGRFPEQWLAWYPAPTLQAHNDEVIGHLVDSAENAPPMDAESRQTGEDAQALHCAEGIIPSPASDWPSRW